MFNFKLANERNCVAIDYESGISQISIDMYVYFLYTPQDYYDVIIQCRQNKKCILHEMKRENFVSAKIYKSTNLQNNSKMGKKKY